MIKALRVAVYIIFLCSFSKEIWGAAQFKNIRYCSTKEFTRVVLDLSKLTPYKAFILKSPPRLVIDINNAKSKVAKREIIINDQIIKKVRASQFSPSVVRVVVDILKEADYNIFTLGRYKSKTERIVIDLSLPEIVEKERKNRNIIRDRKRDEYKVVVIDPGHGGEDPGAIGHYRTKEKDVVLKISKKLWNEINAEKGIKAYLTRSQDYFIPLRKRIDIAMEYGADLFLSIHADASFNRKARGASVYCLSLRAADREASRIISKNSNITNWIFEEEEKFPKNLKKDVQKILFDLHQTQVLNQSLILGGITLKELDKFSLIRFKQPKQAGFVVLKSPKFPSVLIETGFLSNPRDERLLKQDSFQNKLARSISRAVMYFLKYEGGKQRLPKT
ncbi:MAG: N-acetylmuramoyl-L-alanine amidase [Thermodesulfobacteriota bacterium]|nr:N-acetylmuramoyl-L-alanine amidase [Thermodesulfobacteriota bacterium]